MNKKKWIYGAFVIILILTAVLLVIFKEKEPIRIGYSSGTTGMLSEVGVDGRNSFLLKVKEVNDAGGIAGRKIETYIMDDANDPTTIPAIYEEFDTLNVHLIIGHIISALDEAVLEQAKGNKLIMSASMSSATMDAIDDNFIRLSSSFSGQVQHISQYMNEIDHIDSLAVIYDLRNRTYTEGFYNEMTAFFEGSVIGYTIGEASDISYEEILKDIISKDIQGILMLTPANETAKICQLIDKEELELSRYSVSWSMTNDLFEEGGKSVNGTKIVYVKATEGYTEKYEAYRQRFIDEYGYEPSTICFNTYEVTSLLFDAIETSGSTDIDVLKKLILNSTSEGLLGDIIIDEFGDRQQNFTMFNVLDGEFIPIE